MKVNPTADDPKEDLHIEVPKEYPIADEPKEDSINDKKSSKIGRTSY